MSYGKPGYWVFSHGVWGVFFFAYRSNVCVHIPISVAIIGFL